MTIRSTTAQPGATASAPRPGAALRPGAPLPPGFAGLGLRRQLTGAAVLVVGLPVLVAVMVPARGSLSLAIPVLLVLLLVTVGAVIGGRWVALPGALAGALLLNWFFTPPFGTLLVESPAHLVVLAVYLTVALVVSATVDVAARRTAEAARARAEAEALSALAGGSLAEDRTLPDVLLQVRTVFGMREAALRERTSAGWRDVELSSADPVPTDDEVERVVPAGPDLALVVRGPELFAADLRVLHSFAETAATALQGRRLAQRAAEAAQLEAADRARTALLAGVGHDLRTPLAAVKAAVSSLRQHDIPWTPEEREELLATVEDGADRLHRLVSDLLDASRLQAGAVPTFPETVGLDELVDRALLSLPATDRVRLDLPPTLPHVLVDVALGERVLANLLENALRYSPGTAPVTVSGSVERDRVRCEVIDHGPGIPAERWEDAFVSFRRLGSPDRGQLGDRGPGGLGLGLAVARGFTEAMGGELTPATTPGGGLTMRLELPVAPEPGPR
ncbi:MAG: sensor histidine kinase [Blastococcus sp.]